MAFLWQHDFESFVEREDCLIGYIPKNIDLNLLEEGIKNIPVAFEYTFKELVPQNWNTAWESNFEPVLVHNFCAIRADFHSHYPNHDHEITINPKQAFGTGHHETTFMMIEYMRDINFSNQVIADIGSGTGILAILAEKLGAKEILATDNDPIAVENCIENVQSNSCQNIQVTDDHQVLKNEHYNVILANINQNALMHYKSSFYEALTSKGVIILSGILKERIDEIVEVFEMVGFSKMDHKEKGEWVAIWLNKNE